MNLDEIKLRTGTPYPEIVDAKACAKCVAVLKNLIAERGGELNSVLQFIYQSTVADSSDADLGELFEEIAITDMEHVGLLMHAIVDFGGDPKYETSNGVAFNANCVRYLTKLKDMLEYNIALIEQAKENYNTATQMVSNVSLKQLLTRIAEDKQKQLEALTYIKNTVKFLSV